MDINEIIELEECPVCRGTGMITHEGGWCVQVECTDCSAHTTYVEYDSDDTRQEAEHKVAFLWNMGKVIKSERGE